MILDTREVGCHTTYGQYQEYVVQDTSGTCFPFSRAITLGTYALYLFFQTQVFVLHRFRRNELFYYKFAFLHLCVLLLQSLFLLALGFEHVHGIVENLFHAFYGVATELATAGENLIAFSI